MGGDTVKPIQWMKYQEFYEPLFCFADVCGFPNRFVRFEKTIIVYNKKKKKILKPKWFTIFQV